MMKYKALRVDVRVQLDDMPYDKNDMHATGYKVCFAGSNLYDARNWWNEYINEETGDYEYGR